MSAGSTTGGRLRSAAAAMPSWMRGSRVWGAAGTRAGRGSGAARRPRRGDAERDEVEQVLEARRDEDGERQQLRDVDPEGFGRFSHAGRAAAAPARARAPAPSPAPP